MVGKWFKNNTILRPQTFSKKIMSRNSITFTSHFLAPSHSPPNTFRPELRHHTHSGQRQEAMSTMQGAQVLRLPPLRWCPAAHRHHSNTSGPWWNNQGNHFVGEQWQRMNTPGFQARFVKMPGGEAFITCNGSYLHLEQKQWRQSWFVPCIFNFRWSGASPNTVTQNRSAALKISLTSSNEVKSPSYPETLLKLIKRFWTTTLHKAPSLKKPKKMTDLGGKAKASTTPLIAVTPHPIDMDIMDLCNQTIFIEETLGHIQVDSGWQVLCNMLCSTLLHVHHCNATTRSTSEKAWSLSGYEPLQLPG